MDKRNRLWRRKQQNRVFNVRMIYYAVCGWEILEADGSLNRHPHWFELARAKWAQVYKERALRVVAVCVGANSMIVGHIRRKLRE